MEGQKHKKKAASATTDTKNLAPGTHKCELCEVVCTGKDAFNAHVIGASHQKVYLRLLHFTFPSSKLSAMLMICLFSFDMVSGGK